MNVAVGYFSLLLGLLMVATTSPTSTEPSKMAEGRMFAETMRLALKRPGVADSLGQILPFLRVMPTRQRDQLAVMIRAALRPNLPLQGGQDDIADYTYDQSKKGGDDLVASAASPPNSIVSAAGEDEGTPRVDAMMEGGLPAMMDMAQSARRSNSTRLLANLLPNLDIVNLLKETVASVDDDSAIQGRDFQDRYGIPSGDLRRSGGPRPPLAPLRKRPPPTGNNRRHSVLSSKGNGPPPNMRPPKPYEKIVRQNSQSSRRVIMGGRDKNRPSGSPHKNTFGSMSTESFKNHLQAQAGCRYFGPTVCLSVDYYPRDAILNSIRQKKGFAEALLVNDLRVGGLQDGEPISNNEEFSVCPSEVILAARPQKAMTKNGVWKFIVNIDDLYAQTLRMEACSRPGHSCIHVSPTQGESFIGTSCNQVRNSHRLLAWDEARGIHVDSFEIPTCCSCHLTTGTKPPPPTNVPFSMSTSYTASTSSRPSLLLHPPPSTPPYKRKRPYVRVSSPAPVVEGEVEAAESSPPNRSTFQHNVREGLQSHRTTTPPTSSISTTPFLPRPLSPVAVQETWGEQPTPREPARFPSESHRFPAPLPPPPEHHRPASPVQHLASPDPHPGDSKNTSPQRVNYSYHPILDFFRAGRLKGVEPGTEEEEDDAPEEAKPTEDIASERSDDLEVQGHQRVGLPTFGDGWSPIIPE